jgi:hypothetical protein
MSKNMPKFTTALIIACILLLNCDSAGEINHGIHYEKLDTISLDRVLEIGSSDDYLPGELRQMVVMQDGTLIVSDQRKGTIDQLSSDGIFMTTIAGQGEGPGELPPFFTIMPAGQDSISVWNNQRRQLDTFFQDSSGLFVYGQSETGNTPFSQRLEVIGHIAGDDFFALTGKPDVEFISFDNPDYRDVPVSRVSRSLNIIEDSKYTLQTPNFLFGDPAHFNSRVSMNGFALLGIPPFRYRDRLKLLNDGRYIIGKPKADRAEFKFYDQHHHADPVLTVEIAPRKINPVDIDRALSDENDRNIRQELKGRVDEHKPAFLNFWASNDHLWLYTGSNASGKQFVVLDHEGSPIGKFYLEEFEDLQAVHDDRLYLFNRDPEKGHTIRVYQVNL